MQKINCRLKPALTNNRFLKFLILFYVFFLNIQLFPQNFEIPKPVSYNRDKYFDRIIGEDKNGFYELRFNFKNTGKTFYINQYNRNTLAKTRSIDIDNYLLEDEAARNTTLITDFTKVITYMCLVKERLYIFSKSFNPPEKRDQLLADIYSTKTGEQLVADSLVNEVMSFRYDIYKKKFNVSLSPDSSKILCMVSNSSVGDKIQSTSAFLYNIDDFTLVWEKPLMSSYDNLDMRSVEGKVDKEDNLYCFFSASASINNLHTSGCGISYFGKNEKHEQVLTFRIDNSISVYNTSAEYLANKNRLYFTANFKKITSSGHNAGIIVTTVSSEKKTVASSDTVYFSEANRKKIECSASVGNITKYSFAPVVMKQINNSEYFYTYMDYYEGAGQQTLHGSDMIFITKLNENGKAGWQQLIPRATNYVYATSNNDLTQMNVIVKNNKLGFLFTDNLSNSDTNLNYCEIKTSFNFVNSKLNLILVDETGNLSGKTIYTNGAVVLLPLSVNLITNSGEQIFRYKKGDNEGFGKIALRD